MVVGCQSLLWAASTTRVDQRNAIENGYSTRAEHSALRESSVGSPGPTSPVHPRARTVAAAAAAGGWWCCARLWLRLRLRLRVLVLRAVVVLRWCCGCGTFKAAEGGHVLLLEEAQMPLAVERGVVPSRRREFCHCTDTPCLSLLKHLQRIQGGAIK